jgi:alpha-glucosidase
MLLLTLRGTPTLYYGDEIGMHQLAIAPEDVRDPFEKNVPGIGVGRDGCRTPMQWDATEFAGFSAVRPWLPLPEHYVRDNVVCLDADPRSILSLYKRLIGLRQSCPPLVAGDYHPIAAQGDLLIYRREAGGRAAIVALNLGADPVTVTTSAIGFGSRLLLSTFLDRESELIEGVLDLRGNEGVVVAPP